MVAKAKKTEYTAINTTHEIHSYFIIIHNVAFIS